MLLAIDTSTSAIGAAVHDGERVLARVVHEDVRRHGELLAPAIARVLEEAGVDRRELTRIVCGVGPGPFTGLRVGVVSALVLAHSLGLPAPEGVCSLDALAHQLSSQGLVEGEVLVATDARRKEVYWARYAVRPGAATRLEGPGVARAADLDPAVRGLPTVGRGPLLYPDALPHGLPDGPRDVDPGSLADLAVALASGEHPDAETGPGDHRDAKTGPGHHRDSETGPGRGLLVPEPLYLRRPDAVAQAAGTRP